MPVAAIGAVAAAGAGLAGSAMSASAAKKAGQAQADAAEKAAQVQKDSAIQSRIDAYPWALEGAQAMYMFMDELGVPRPQTPILPDLTMGPFGYNPKGTTAASQPQNAIAAPAQTQDKYIERRGELIRNPQYRAPAAPVPQQTAAPANAIGAPSTIPMTAQKGFTETPGYQFRVNQGEQGVLNSLSALGMKNSGKALKSLETFRQGIASDEYNGWLNRIAGVAGMGQAQTNTTNALTQNAATNMGQAYQDAGQARASGYVGAANAWSSGLQGVGNAIGQITYGR